MMHTIQFFIENTKQLTKVVKDKLFAIYNWKRGDIWALLLKVLLFVLFIIGLHLLLKIIPYMLALIILVGIYLSEKHPTLTVEDIQMQCLYYRVRKLIFDILKENTRTLDIQEIKNVLDITPPSHTIRIIQHTNGTTVFRFIFNPTSSNDKDFPTMRAIINTKLMQQLQEGNMYMPASLYYNFPSVYALNIDEDAINTGYFCIDILPIYDEKSAKYARYMDQKLHNQDIQAKGTPKAPRDEDF